MSNRKKELFRGVGTALITPHKNGEIDYKALEILIERQIDAGVSALVIGGTTGEAATLADKERYTLFEESKKITSGRCKLIFGTGTNDTRVAIKHTEKAERIGCDGVLLVTPYYNKGTKRGIYEHYAAIAKSTELPIILYNVPSRTGVNLPIETIEGLSELDNVVGLKEALADAERYSAASKIPGIALYSGNDADALTVMKLGGSGVISVVSNLYPSSTTEMMYAWERGMSRDAEKIMNKLRPVINSLFAETNPAPLKYALSELGLCRSEMRLPLYEVEESTKALIRDVMRHAVEDGLA